MDGLADDSFLLADRLDDSRRFVTFDALDEGGVAVQVGACPQWTGRSTDVLYLVHHQGAGTALDVRIGLGASE